MIQGGNGSFDRAMTRLDDIARHARVTPGAAAVTDGVTVVTYGRLFVDCHRCAAVLSELGVRAGQLVAISYDDLFRHLILVVAAESLGAATLSFVAPPESASASESASPALSHVLERADLILAGRLSPGLPAFKLRLLSDPWWRDLNGRPIADPPMQDIDAGAMARVLRSSGTTGVAKCIALDHRALEHRLRHAIVSDGLSPSSRLLVLHRLSVTAVFVRVAACLRLGATLLLGSPVKLLVGGRVSHFWALPNDLEALLDRLPANTPPLPGLTAVIAGAPAPETLRHRMRARLGTELRSGYGTNEAGSVLAFVATDGTATPADGVMVRIVDADGRSLPPGVAGIIALRAPGMVTGYWDDDEATRRAFKDGWSLTGDEGLLLGDGRFRIIGRADEVLNMGGLKISPVLFEEALKRAVDGISDVVAAARSAPEEELGLGVVPRAGADWMALAQGIAAHVRRMLPLWHGHLHLFRLERLPRTEAGKIHRPVLFDRFPTGPRK